MGKNLKQWLFNKIFKKEIEENKEIMKEMYNNLESKVLDNIHLMNGLKEANDMIKLYEEEIEKLEKENRMMTLIVGSMKIYER